MSENSNNVGIIKISETAETDVKAVSAKLHLEITGENFVYGNAAMEKSAEVKSLVESLKQVGVGGESVMVKDVSVQTETGFFNKSSKGTYKICVRVENLELMAGALGAVAEQKNCRLTRTEWVFNEDEARVEVAREAMVKAKHKADSMMSAVGYKVVGIKTCSDVYEGLPKEQPRAANPGMMRMMADSAHAPADIGTQFQNENTVSAQVFVEFIIAENE